MSEDVFVHFFRGAALEFLLRGIETALLEDGRDLTSEALFSPSENLRAEIVAKERSIVCGLPLIPLVLEKCANMLHTPVPGHVLRRREGETVEPGSVLAEIEGRAGVVLKAERVILNFMTHLSGIANLTREYVQAVSGTHTRILDTRKTLPGLRYPEKYAVLTGGGRNHRLNLEEMLMLKDNHIDRAGGIAGAVGMLRAAYDPCPPIEVECRSASDVREAVTAGVHRIMLDNMAPSEIAESLKLIPPGIESEVSGGVNLDNVAEIASLGPDFVSVGRLTHSARAADMSMRIAGGRQGCG